MILRSGSKGINVLNVASSLVNRAARIWHDVDGEFMRIKGIGKEVAATASCYRNL